MGNMTKVLFYCKFPAESKDEIILGTVEEDRTVLYKTKSLDGTKPNTNPNPNTNPFSCFMLFSSTVP